MVCTEDLVEEHAAVLTALGILDVAAGRLEAGQRVEPADLGEMLEFLGVFVEMCHHTKEERYLFPAIEREGGQAERDAVERLVREHDAARVLVKAMRDEVRRYREGEAGVSADLVATIRSYEALLRAHIRAEEGDLFPSAEERLREETKLELVRSFDSVERDVVGDGRHEAFHEMLRRQRDSYPAESGREDARESRG